MFGGTLATSSATRLQCFFWFSLLGHMRMFSGLQQRFTSSGSLWSYCDCGMMWSIWYPSLRTPSVVRTFSMLCHDVNFKRLEVMGGLLLTIFANVAISVAPSLFRAFHSLWIRWRTFLPGSVLAFAEADLLPRSFATAYRSGSALVRSQDAILVLWQRSQRFNWRGWPSFPRRVDHPNFTLGPSVRLHLLHVFILTSPRHRGSPHSLISACPCKIDSTGPPRSWPSCTPS